jgi:hypothetical protein
MRLIPEDEESSTTAVDLLGFICEMKKGLDVDISSGSAISWQPLSVFRLQDPNSFTCP